MDKAALEPVTVFSPIEDKDIRNTLGASPIWKQAYHETEVVEAKRKHTDIYEYSFKFEGLIPRQVTGVKKHLK